MLNLLRSNSELRRIFAAHAVSRAGDSFNTVALVVLVFDLTGSARGVAGAVMFEVLPVLLLGPVAGLAADRLPRRRLMVAADMVRAIAAGSLVLLSGSVGVVFVVAFVLSSGAMLFNPASSSLLPDVVDDDEDLVTANAALWTAAVVGQVTLAPTAGVVIAVFGVRAAFAVNAATFVASAVLLRGLRAGRTAAGIDVRGWRSALAGVKAVRAHPLLARLAVVQVLASLSAGATSGLLVVLAEQRLGVGPGGFGTLLACIGVGAAVGPVVLRRFLRPVDRRWLFGPYLVRGGVDATLATVTAPAVAGGALVLYGMSTSTGMVAYQSTLQRVVPAELRGRAFAFYDVAWNGARLISLGLGGVLADQFAVHWVYAGGAVLLFAAAGVGFSGSISDLRAADRQ